MAAALGCVLGAAAAAAGSLLLCFRFLLVMFHIRVYLAS